MIQARTDGRKASGRIAGRREPVGGRASSMDCTSAGRKDPPSSSAKAGPISSFVADMD